MAAMPRRIDAEYGSLSPAELPAKRVAGRGLPRRVLVVGLAGATAALVALLRRGERAVPLARLGEQAIGDDYSEYVELLDVLLEREDVQQMVQSHHQVHHASKGNLPPSALRVHALAVLGEAVAHEL